MIPIVKRRTELGKIKDVINELKNVDIINWEVDIERLLKSEAGLLYSWEVEDSPSNVCRMTLTVKWITKEK